MNTHLAPFSFSAVAALALTAVDYVVSPWRRTQPRLRASGQRLVTP